MLNERELRNFQRKIDKKPDGCWWWNASKTRGGYGKVKLRRFRDREFLAHRVAKAHYHGENINSELFFCHKCDNPACVNPDHIFLGTPQDNVDDMIKKGGHSVGDRRGSKNGANVLNESMVEEILAKLNLMTNVDIAKEYGVTHSTISLIRRGKSWKHCSIK